MNRVFFTLVLLLLAASIGLPVVTVADGDAPSASGSFQISLENGHLQEIKFNARLAKDGSTTGEITFRDEEAATGSKPAGNGAGGVAPTSFLGKAVCNCLVVRGIEAVMVGTITEASREDYIGRRVVLVVQDGDSLNPPLRDKLTFAFYKPTTKGWVETDGERPADEQTLAPTWIATDAERPDDAGILSQKSEEIVCESFPLSAYTFIGSRYAKGKIKITQ